MLDTEKIIDSIYEASIVPDRWAPVLESLANVADSVGSILLVRDTGGWSSIIASSKLKDPIANFAQTDIPLRTQTTERLLDAKHPGFLTEQDLFTPDEVATDPLFSEWARPAGLGSGMATAIEISTGDFVVFQLFRKIAQKHYDPKLKARADALRPHLARSTMLSARLRLQRLQAAAEALAIIGLPAAILSPNGRILAANDLLQKMAKHVRWLPQDRMALADAPAHTMFEQALNKPGKAGAACSCSFPVPAANGGDLVVGHLIPTPGQARDIFDGASAIFVITPLTMPQGPDVSLIQALFDLTPAEARVARGVVEGETVDSLALRFGVSSQTVRTQLNSVLAKTGAQRQSVLAARLSIIGRTRI